MFKNIALVGVFLLLSAPSFDITGDQMWANKKLRERLPGDDSAAPLQLCDVIQAGDKSGNWDCIKGDGTMLSGSATTWVATGTPTNSIEGSGYPVRTYTSTQNDKQPSNAAFPASSFSVCQHFRFPGTGGQNVFAFGTAGSPANYSVIVDVNAAHTNTGFYASNGVSPTLYTVAQTFTDNTWYLYCHTYSRTGGAANNVVTIYINGSSIGTRSTEALVQALSSVWTSNGYASGSNGGAKAMRGQFVTYKVLSAPDIARIYAAIQN